MRYTKLSTGKNHKFVVVKSFNGEDWKIVEGYDTLKEVQDAVLDLQGTANKAGIRVKYDWREFV
jgi:hypothetical protein